jgi:hypothetical protein
MSAFTLTVRTATTRNIYVAIAETCSDAIEAAYTAHGDMPIGVTAIPFKLTQ